MEVIEQVVVAAAAAMSATLVTNPLEVVKTRFQLQGELNAKGQYMIHYRNFFHAFYTIAKTDGLLALQKGLVPSLYHQLFMNGIRLSGFQLAEKYNLTRGPDGEKSIIRTAGVAGFLGGVTAFTGSPFFLVKIHLQAQSSKTIAVGTQHNSKGMFSELLLIYSKQGVRGLWRGSLGSLPRRIVGSTSQLTTFTLAKDFLETNQYYQIPKGYLNSLLGGMIGGVIVTLVMNPLDTISTRLYNQAVDSNGKGVLYSSYSDCVKKMYKTEGLHGFYKGLVPLYLRTGPHTALLLLFWDTFKGFSQF